jgi:hypothetical protein
MVIAQQKAIPMADAVLSALLFRRATALAEIRRTETAMKKLLADVEHIDAAILMFDESYRPTSPAVNYTGSGQITRTLLTIMRKAKEPMGLRDLTMAMMRELGLAHEDPKRVKRTLEQVRTALARQIVHGTVAKEYQGPTRMLVWRIAG